MSDGPYDVFVKSGGSTITMLHSADLKTATDRAKTVAKKEGRSAFVLNKTTNAVQEFKP